MGHNINSTPVSYIILLKEMARARKNERKIRHLHSLVNRRTSKK